MSTREPRYLSFLLRLWPVKQNGNETWRASLENPHTGEQRGFANLELMMSFLLQQMQQEENKEQHNQKSRV